MCPNMFLGVMLQDPAERMMLTMIENNFKPGQISDLLRPDRTNQNHTDLTLSHTGCLPDWDGFHRFDNFATRTLGGHYRVPFGHVNRTHLELAKQQLRKMHIVLIAEDFASHVGQLNVNLGWNLTKPGMKTAIEKGLPPV